MKRFNNKYRIPSARLANYDYSSNGDYFITICTSDRIKYFGKIKNAEMILNEMGIIVEGLMLLLSDRFQNIRIVEHIIMPDHIHLIVKIDKPKIKSHLKTQSIASLESIESKMKGGVTSNHNPMFKDSIPKIIRWFKGRATFELRKINKEFAWQTRYYDRIIRNKNEYFAIIQYIKSNPEKWGNDI